MRGLPLYSPATHLHGFCSLPNLRVYYIKKILLAKVSQTGFITPSVPFAERQFIKMKKTPYLYNTIQSEEIQEFISDNFGKGGGYIAHELKSEYVHTDTMLIESKNADRTFVTFGMGARKMNTPNNAKRCELVMCATKNIAT